MGKIPHRWRAENADPLLLTDGVIARDAADDEYEEEEEEDDEQEEDDDESEDGYSE